MNITVYLGAHPGKDPAFRELAYALGAWIGKNGHTLVYGGSKMGLMGKLARGALDRGGRVIGVEPEFFIEQAAQEEDLTRLIVTKDMTDRKLKMQELGDVFLAFPGGIGTLEEISQVMCWNKLNLLPKPFAFLNFNGYYNPLKAFFQTMEQQEFLDGEWVQEIPFLDSIEEVEKFVQNIQNLHQPEESRL